MEIGEPINIRPDDNEPDETLDIPTEKRIENKGREDRVSPLEPDFLLILLFAMVADGLQLLIFIAQILTLFTVGELMSIAFNSFNMLIIGGWVYWRTKRLSKSKQQKATSLKQNAGKKMTSMKKQLAKGASPMRKFLLRGGISLLGKAVPFLELVPFWTITVVSTLREK